MNFRSVPSFNFIGFLPDQVNSNIEPKLSGFDPEIVPEPIISPEFTLQPLLVWCANCCDIDQYKYLKFDLETVVGATFSGAIATSRLISNVCLPFCCK